MGISRPVKDIGDMELTKNRVKGTGGKPRGVRPKLENKDLFDQAVRMGGLGMSPPSVSRSLGLRKDSIREWLRLGEAGIEEGLESIYTKFYTAWHRAFEETREMALQRMLTSKDDRLIERWLVRTDREQDYEDWERLQVAEAGRTNVQVLNAPQNALGALDAVKQRMLDEGTMPAGKLARGESADADSQG